jgi:hypothetical protein
LPAHFIRQDIGALANFLSIDSKRKNLMDESIGFFAFITS